ncbi:MAG TPA: hypothetical protein VFB08_15795 [Burkholderiales bacterium]|nr:hypothetical protein [Burkholderiales bacterium]
MILIAFGCYLSAHFLLYALLLRHRRFIATERGIFLYHFVPAASWATLLAAFSLASSSVSAADVLLVASLHGIYSLSFLELWALADGGYSLAIIDQLAGGRNVPERSALEPLAAMGTAKRRARLADLVRMGLVEERPEGYRLTPSGRTLAGLIWAIAKLSGVPMVA